MYPHRIRLRGPWECEPLARSPASTDQPLPAPCRLTMPCRWRDSMLQNFAGKVRCRRRFGLPRQLDAHERVWLTFAGIAGTAAISVNGQSLGAALEGPYPLAYEVTALLHPRNELVVEVAADDSDGGLYGEVALEIRTTAYLRHVQVALDATGAGRLTVTGEVVGVADRPLDLYVLVNGQTVHYSTVTATVAGQPFTVLTDVPERLPLGPAEVRVELVNGAVVWYGSSEVVQFPT